MVKMVKISEKKKMQTYYRVYLSLSFNENLPQDPKDLLKLIESKFKNQFEGFEVSQEFLTNPKFQFNQFNSEMYRFFGSAVVFVEECKKLDLSIFQN